MRNQIIDALKNESNIGLGFPFFKQHIGNGIPFSVITARAHDPANMLRAFDTLINLTFSENEIAGIAKNFVANYANVFNFKTENGWWGEYFASQRNVVLQYLRGCTFVPVTNPWFVARHACGDDTAACKAEVIRGMMADILPFGNKTVIMSFFDDDSDNVREVGTLMKNELVAQYPNVCFRIYDTYGPTAVQNDYSPICESLPVGQDWESAMFLRLTGGLKMSHFRA